MSGRLVRALGVLAPDDAELLRHLSAYTKQANLYDDVFPILDTETWRDAARAHSRTTVSAKGIKLLRAFEAQSTHPGDDVMLELPIDYALIDALTAEELRYFLTHAEEAGLTRTSRNLGPDRFYGRLTVRGWELIAPHPTTGIPGRVFVAMSFDPALDEAYHHGIASAFRECGIEPRRVDQIQHVEDITDRIIAEIKLAQFMVADFTGQRAGVYFEAGYAMGLGRPVIWMCRQDDMPNVHFDTRQYAHIVWTTPDDLRQKLLDRVRAVILR